MTNFMSNYSSDTTIVFTTGILRTLKWCLKNSSRESNVIISRCITSVNDHRRHIFTPKLTIKFLVQFCNVKFLLSLSNLTNAIVQIITESNLIVDLWQLSRISDFNFNNTKTSNEETTVTVDANYSTPIITFDNSGKVIVVRTATPEEKFTVDYLEKGSRADKVASYIGQFGGDQAIYRIKGTNNWLYSMGVMPASKITAHNYDLENYSLVKFPKAADLYNGNGVSLNAKMKKNYEWWKVDKLVYIWIPSENKIEEFYHLSPFTKGYEIDYIQYASYEIGANTTIYDKGAYVKTSDVQLVENSIKLTPSNTPEEAQAAAMKK